MLRLFSTLPVSHLPAEANGFGRRGEDSAARGREDGTPESERGGCFNLSTDGDSLFPPSTDNDLANPDLPPATPHPYTPVIMQAARRITMAEEKANPKIPMSPENVRRLMGVLVEAFFCGNGGDSDGNDDRGRSGTGRGSNQQRGGNRGQPRLPSPDTSGEYDRHGNYIPRSSRKAQPQRARSRERSPGRGSKPDGRAPTGRSRERSAGRGGNRAGKAPSSRRSDDNRRGQDDYRRQEESASRSRQCPPSREPAGRSGQGGRVPHFAVPPAPPPPRANLPPQSTDQRYNSNEGRPQSKGNGKNRSAYSTKPPGKTQREGNEARPQGGSKGKQGSSKLLPEQGLSAKKQHSKEGTAAGTKPLNGIRAKFQLDSVEGPPRQRRLDFQPPKKRDRSEPCTNAGNAGLAPTAARADGTGCCAGDASASKADMDAEHEDLLDLLEDDPPASGEQSFVRESTPIDEWTSEDYQNAGMMKDESGLYVDK